MIFFSGELALHDFFSEIATPPPPISNGPPQIHEIFRNKTKPNTFLKQNLQL